MVNDFSEKLNSLIFVLMFSLNINPKMNEIT